MNFNMILMIIIINLCLGMISVFFVTTVDRGLKNFVVALFKFCLS